MYWSDLRTKRFFRCITIHRYVQKSIRRIYIYSIYRTIACTHSIDLHSVRTDDPVRQLPVSCLRRKPTRRCLYVPITVSYQLFRYEIWTWRTVTTNRVKWTLSHNQIVVSTDELWYTCTHAVYHARTHTYIMIRHVRSATRIHKTRVYR